MFFSMGPCTYMDNIVVRMGLCKANQQFIIISYILSIQSFDILCISDSSDDTSADIVSTKRNVTHSAWSCVNSVHRKCCYIIFLCIDFIVDVRSANRENDESSFWKIKKSKKKFQFSFSL